MELAWLGVIISTATASLIYPVSILLARSGTRRMAVLLGAILAMIIFSGQGYTQIGLVLSSPAFLFLIMNDKFRFKPVWRRFVMAVILGLLLAAPFLVPLLHFWPNFIKPSDTFFDAHQPLEYFVLNFVIRDREYHLSPILSKPTSAAHTAMYIGWVPVILAFLLPKYAVKKDHRTLFFLFTSAALLVVAGSGLPFEWLVNIFPSLYQVRTTMMIAPLAVTPILALSGYALDKIMKSHWPVELTLRSSEEGQLVAFNSKWFMLIPLVWSVFSVLKFSDSFMWTGLVNENVDRILDSLETPSLQWVQPPAGQWVFIETAIRRGMKLSPGIMPYDWKNRAWPEPYLQAAPQDKQPEGCIDPIRVDNYVACHFPGNREYAYVETDAKEIIPCKAHGWGGDLRVSCDNSEGGDLVVQENTWTSWYAWRDGEQVELLGWDWLVVAAPPGEHEYRFRYIPWDVPLGVLFALFGVGLCVWQWRKPEGDLDPAEANKESEDQPEAAVVKPDD
jgi:hypothetical protein